MTTSFVVVACTSDRRWFDLDAVRGERLPDTVAGPEPGLRRARDTGTGANHAMAERTYHANGGAPPLDWHDDNDPPPPPRDGAPMTTNTITVHIGDTRTVTATMPDNSIDLLVTSPPFLALRSYLPADHPDKAKEIGSEPIPAAFIDTMLDLTAEWRRIVTPTGSICVEIGDTYSGSGGDNHLYDTGYSGHRTYPVVKQPAGSGRSRDTSTGWPLAKSLCMIPELYGVALAYGINPVTGTPSPAGRWRVRNWLTWTRPNPPVGALGDKFRPATSFVTVACVSDRRWFDLDAVRGEHDPRSVTRSESTAPRRMTSRATACPDNGENPNGAPPTLNPAGAPPLDWHHDDWQPLHRLPTAPYAGAHYATYPLALPTKLIEAMCPREVCVVCGEARRRIVDDTPEYAAIKGAWKWGGDISGKSRKANPTNPMQGGGAQHTTLGWTDCGCLCYSCRNGGCPVCEHERDYRPGIVFDPFAGSGTTLLTAALAGRDAVGIDLDDRNLDLIRHRIGEALLIVNERTDGNTVTFTVRADMPGTKGEHPDQLNLFATDGA